MPLANAGAKVPLLIFNADRVAMDDVERVTTTVYVFEVAPSCAVTTVVMVFAPVFKFIAADAVPEVTVVPLTFTVAVALLVVGVTVMEVTVLPTLAV